ncbi:MAG: serine/threonine protein kinase [Bacteroides sp.]|nr:serine/threonine protein kinase [Bacteroides sp.]
MTNIQLKEGSELQGGKYRIIRVLGQGGFGITYLALDTRYNLKVAIKEFFPKDACKREPRTGFVILPLEVGKFKKKFVAESRKIAKLSHSGIVKVNDTFEENGTAYYVMDYIEGQSLYDLIKVKEFNKDEATKIILDVADALAHIHSKRMLHLDIKPMNIMMRSSDNAPVIIDFGISKTYDAQGDPNTTFLGAYSPGYSSPEQLEGKINSFAPQLDVYSLGATFYTLLTGNIPRYPTPHTVANLSFKNNIPNELIKVIGLAMAYEQNERYSLVSEFSRDLKQIYQKSHSKGTEIIGPVIRNFRLLKGAPYYVGEPIEVMWSVNYADQVFLNKDLLETKKGTKSIQYKEAGNKRLTLKCIRGEHIVRRILTFKVEDGSKPDEPINVKESPIRRKKSEETKIIVADCVNETKPTIDFFWRAGNQPLHVGDEVTFHWGVTGADSVTFRGIQLDNNCTKKAITLKKEGPLTVVLAAWNKFGRVWQSIDLNVLPKKEEKGESPVIDFFWRAGNQPLHVGDEVTVHWSLSGAEEVQVGGFNVGSGEKSKTLRLRRAGRQKISLVATNRFGQVKNSLELMVLPKENQTQSGENGGNTGYSVGTSEDTISENKAGLGAGWIIIVLAFVCWLIGFIGSNSAKSNQTEAVATEVVEEAVEVVEEATEVPAYDYYY